MNRPQQIRKSLAAALLLVAAALALGVGTASAEVTKLCKASETICSAANTYPSGTELKFSTGKEGKEWYDDFKTSTVEVKCTVGISDHSTASSGNPLPDVLDALSFSGCFVVGSGTTCTAAAVNLPWKTTMNSTSPGNGTWAWSSGGTGNPGRTLVCGSLVNCTYTAATISSNFVGGILGTANATGTNIAMTGSGKVCPTATWSFKTPMTGPAPVWIEH